MKWTIYWPIIYPIFLWNIYYLEYFKHNHSPRNYSYKYTTSIGKILFLIMYVCVFLMCVCVRFLNLCVSVCVCLYLNFVCSWCMLVKVCSIQLCIHQYTLFINFSSIQSWIFKSRVHCRCKVRCQCHVRCRFQRCQGNMDL